MRRSLSFLRERWEVAALLLAAALVYQPWAATALPILDFSEFLPILTAHASPFAQFGEVARYMATQGRFCPLLFAYIVATWNLFGMWAPGWHFSYFVLNAAVIVFAQSFFVRLGAKRSAVIFALAIWTFSPPVAAGWLRPTGEPIGLLLMLAALSQAYNFADARDWRSRAVVIAALAVGMIAAKEMLVVLLPAVWLMTRLTHRDGKWEWAPWSKRDAVVTSASFAATLAALVPVAFVARTAPAGNYAGRYGSVPFSLDAFIARLEVATLPSRAELPKLVQLVNDPLWQWWLGFPNYMWITVVLVAMTIVFVRSRANGRSGSCWPLVLGALWLLPGVLAYVPWPSEATFYMLPFTLGLTFIAAHAFSSMLERRSSGIIAFTAVAAILGISIIEARDLVDEHNLRIHTDQSILEAASRAGRDLPLYAAVPAPAPPGVFGWGKKLGEYGRAAGMISPSRAVDVGCVEGMQRARMHEAAIIVSAAEGCGSLGGETIVVVQSVPRHRWPWILEEKGNRRMAFVTRAGERVAAEKPKTENAAR